jgi:hypothetical protein
MESIEHIPAAVIMRQIRPCMAASLDPERANAVKKAIPAEAR